ncbi:MAG TPA: hypothetical protein VK674_07365 [Candidatus Limnocylindria bacterium]|nr:hypothetical protein [Candidatus Limnocylindria bacterium]
MTVKHTFSAMLQPTNHACTQAATAMLLSHYDPSVTVAQVMRESPTQKKDDGNEAGSSMQRLATYCLDKGYEVELYSFDAIILDLSWRNLSDQELLKKLEKIKESREVKNLGKGSTRQLIEEYIAFIKKGGKLIIKPYPDTQLLSDLIKQGPLCVAISHPTMTGAGHTKSLGVREDVQDDLENGISTHAVLAYGQDKAGNYLISDPWGDPQDYTATPDQLIASIMAAQWLCDNIIFRISS